MPYRVIASSLPDVPILEPLVHADDRGFFFESFSQRDFASVTGVETIFVQDNHSRSERNVLRGLHYQVVDPQAKLVRVARGQVFDVAVDLRRSSESFGHWTGTMLSDDNRRQVFIPAGFAHGFLVLSDTADVLYKSTAYYASQHDRCIAWNDATLAIRWPIRGAPRLSAKDARGLPFEAAELFD